MNLRDITDKLKDTIIPKDDKKEDIEPNINKENESVEDESMEYEEKPISDEIEQSGEQPIKIKTVFVKSGDDDEENNTRMKISGAVKVAAGVGIVAAGIAALLLGSRKKKW